MDKKITGKIGLRLTLLLIILSGFQQPVHSAAPAGSGWNHALFETKSIKIQTAVGANSNSCDCSIDRNTITVNASDVSSQYLGVDDDCRAVLLTAARSDSKSDLHPPRFFEKIPSDDHYGNNAAVLAAVTQSVDLVPGWNLISFSVQPASTVITEVLSSIDGQYDLVYAWDAGAQAWKYYDPTVPPLVAGDLTDLDETMGFWIHIKESTLVLPLDVEGTAPVTTTISLDVGWNLLGYPSVTSSEVITALADLDGNYEMVYAYHAGDAKPWKRFDPDAPAWSNTLKTMEEGWGYWIKASSAADWIVDYE